MDRSVALKYRIVSHHIGESKFVSSFPRRLETWQCSHLLLSAVLL